MRKIGNHYSFDGTVLDAGRGCLYTLVLAGAGEGPEERLLPGLNADSAPLITAALLQMCARRERAYFAAVGVAFAAGALNWTVSATSLPSAGSLA